MCEQLKKAAIASSNAPIDHKNSISSSNIFDSEGLKQQVETLTNEKNSLLKKIESLSRETNKGDNLLERKCEELTK
jgi:uncharacterized protein YlxW (UPF0749 family)